MKTHFSPWRNVEIGRYRESGLIRSALQKKWIKIGHVANYALDKIAYRQVAHWVDLALVSVSDLGFQDRHHIVRVLAQQEH
jgi:hypothetical protein